jgi:hypothetical protein
MQVILIYLSAITFIFYGLLCLLTDHMKKEFHRYGLSQFRTLTGYLELLGGIGLLVGRYYPLPLLISSAGLSLLMFLGIIVRFKTKDPLVEILPAFLLMIINLTILYLI